MSLERNIERIAEALERIARAAEAGRRDTGAAAGSGEPLEGGGFQSAGVPVPGQAPDAAYGQPGMPGTGYSTPGVQSGPAAPGVPFQQGGPVPAGPGAVPVGVPYQPPAPGVPVTLGVPVQQGGFAAPETPVQQGGSAVPAASGSQGGGTLPGGTVPTTNAPQQYTFDQLAVATANLASSGRDVFSVLGRFGVNMLMDLPREKYGEYAAALREAGAVL